MTKRKVPLRIDTDLRLKLKVLGVFNVKANVKVSVDRPVAEDDTTQKAIAGTSSSPMLPKK